MWELSGVLLWLRLPLQPPSPRGAPALRHRAHPAAHPDGRPRLALPADSRGLAPSELLCEAPAAGRGRRREPELGLSAPLFSAFQLFSRGFGNEEWLVKHSDPVIIRHPTVVLFADLLWRLASYQFMASKLYFLLTLCPSENNKEQSYIIML